MDIVDRVAAAGGTDRETAEGALRIVLAFLRKEGPAETVDGLVAALGLEGLSEREAPRRGWLGSIAGALGGGAMAAFSALSGLGLDLDQIQAMMEELMKAARERVGDEPVDEILAAIPGLAQFV